jgi:hypothetical protein
MAATNGSSLASLPGRSSGLGRSLAVVALASTVGVTFPLTSRQQWSSRDHKSSITAARPRRYFTELPVAPPFKAGRALLAA